MQLKRLPNRPAGGYTSFASVWNPGDVPEPIFSLHSDAGKEIPVQSRTTAYWPDGSVKWAAHTADSEKMGEGATVVLGAPAPVAAPLLIQKQEDGFEVDTGMLRFLIPGKGDSLLRSVRCRGEVLASRVYPVLSLEGRAISGKSTRITQTSYDPFIASVECEETGPLEAVFCFHGIHRHGKAEKMRFQIRLYAYAQSAELRFEHTFFFDGDEKEDFLHGMGICFEMALKGQAHQRHIQFTTDQGVFHEAATLLNCNAPRLSRETLRKQLQGDRDGYEEKEAIQKALLDLPVWNRYALCQDSSRHFSIRKQTEATCCMIDCRQGGRSSGAMAVTSLSGGVMLSIRDFWKKHPSGLEVSGLGGEETECTAWFYSPQATAYDFRHYATRSYPKSSYEGFDYMGATAYGIGVTSSLTAVLVEGVPEDRALDQFAERVQRPCFYMASPEALHEKHAFGAWSLPKEQTEMERYLEGQLQEAFAFYRDEVEAQDWYGLFDYGDVMHTYDPVRHTWRYDMGGYAWQNTELVPTYWLWLYFLRTGREDVFTLAEAMTRHCGDVDFYHFGPLKGIGTRHNVRHWGCSCKEPRVSMAGHHRFLYYLRGERRIGDILDDAKDADASLCNIRQFREGNGPVLIRTGPDWSSFVSNWMTCYERTLDVAYRRKIEAGIGDLAAAPFGLASGPEFSYDPKTGHLVYQGEDEDNFNMHLQICMGGPQIWLETADMLESEALRQLLADHGRFYFLPKEEKDAQTGGAIVNRAFSYPFFAAGLGAYSAKCFGDEALSKQIWRELLCASSPKGDMKGFSERSIYGKDNAGKPLSEIPWITTNYTAQWCLNIIIALAFIDDWLPETMNEAKELMKTLPDGQFHR